jgi:Zn-dependent protease with chaperone function
MKFRITMLMWASLAAVWANLARTETNSAHGFAVTNAGNIAPEVSPQGPATNTVRRLAAVESLTSAVSRYQEHEAERFALELTRNNHASALSFVKMQRENLGVPRSAFLVRVWRGTHPALGERIDFANAYHPWTAGEAGEYEHLFKST